MPPSQFRHSSRCRLATPARRRLQLSGAGGFSAAVEEQAIRALRGGSGGPDLQAFVQSETARRLLAECGSAVVEISEIRGKEPIEMAVGVSNFDTAYAMTVHLAEKGYRKIAFVSTPVHGNDRLQQRCIGYRQAIADRGLPDQPRLEVEVPITPRGGAEALGAIMDGDPEVDVIFFPATRSRSAPCRSATAAAGASRNGSPSPATATWISAPSSFRRSPPSMCRATKWGAARSPSCCIACRPDASTRRSLPSTFPS